MDFDSIFGGGGYDDEIGGVPTANLLKALKLNPSIAKAVMQHAQSGGAAALELARGDDFIYGFDSGAAGVATAASSSITASPQKRHVPVRLVMTESVAEAFALSSITVGVDQVLATTGNLSCGIFQPNSNAPDFRAVPCEVGTDVTVTVTNLTGGTRRFLATMVGRYLPR